MVVLNVSRRLTTLHLFLIFTLACLGYDLTALHEVRIHDAAAAIGRAQRVVHDAAAAEVKFLSVRIDVAR